MQFDEIEEMSAIAIKKNFERNGFDFNIDLIIDALIRSMKEFDKESKNVKDEITSMIMLMFAIADEYKFDLQDMLISRIEEVNEK